MMISIMFDSRIAPMDFQELASHGKLAVDVVSNSVDLVKKLRDISKRTDKGGVPAAELAEITLELQDKLIDARFAQLALLDALGDLKHEVEEADRRLELQRRYEAAETMAGAFVLQLKDTEANSEPSHYICPHCAEKGLRSFLQPHGSGKRCNPCEAFFPFAPPVDRPGSSHVSRMNWLDR